MMFILFFNYLLQYCINNLLRVTNIVYSANLLSNECEKLNKTLKLEAKYSHKINKL